MLDSMICWGPFQPRVFYDFMVLFFVRDIHLVLLVIWYPVLKATFILQGFQVWILACTLIFVFYSLIHQLYSCDQRRQSTVFQRGSQPISEASNTCVPWWYCQTFPKILAGLREGCFSCEPLSNSTEKPQQALKQDSVSPSLCASFSFGCSTGLPFA